MRAVAWLQWWRVVDSRGRVQAVCETLDEAQMYIAAQP
jgi:alkylated DNA nucleotide flippase Atl1